MQMLRGQPVNLVKSTETQMLPTTGATYVISNSIAVSPLRKKCVSLLKLKFLQFYRLACQVSCSMVCRHIVNDDEY